MLALANFGPFKENREESGFVLVTADAPGWHGRRACPVPVVLSTADATLGMDPALPPE
ncbi:MAG TPA: hypothetical protein VGP06_05080 [Janthinobacterium sp.]|jgi:hypothetical protein|nr:hypothetical protein [Janthinobacterium sp.]